MKIDTVTMPTPSSMQQDIEPIVKAERTESGEMFKEFIAEKRKLNCTWNYLTNAQAVTLFDAIEPNFISIEYEDIKTGTTLSPAVGPQTAAYVIAAEEYLDVPTIKRRFCVQLMPNAYKLHQLKESMDSYTFIAALNNYNWRLKHGTA